MPVAGVIFDLDGTLIDSGLDFDQMRQEMNLPPGMPILEELAGLPDGPHLQHCLRVLAQHERAGAMRASLMPGVRAALDELIRLQLRLGILTRNSRDMTRLTLERLDLHFTHIMTRDDAPPKPDPAGLLAISGQWGVRPAEILFVGDYLFDLQAGRQAGMATVLYAPNGRPPYADEADHVIDHFSQLPALLHASKSA